jgi:hypothetical protein
VEFWHTSARQVGLNQKPLAITEATPELPCRPGEASPNTSGYFEESCSGQNVFYERLRLGCPSMSKSYEQPQFLPLVWFNQFWDSFNELFVGIRTGCRLRYRTPRTIMRPAQDRCAAVAFAAGKMPPSQARWLPTWALIGLYVARRVWRDPRRGWPSQWFYHQP